MCGGGSRGTIDAQFARDLSNAQRTAAKLEPKVDELVTILRQGERDRNKVTTPRWQAGYDIAMGRSLGVIKVRTEGLQHDAGPRQARSEVQGSEKRYLGPAANRFGLP